jgi:hypothetical protein
MHDHSLLPCRAVLAAAMLSSLALAPATARADAVTEWNEFGVRATPGPPPPQFRTLAIMHLAIHDALNAIQPRYETYTAQPPAPAGASPEAAVIAAAFGTLRQLVAPAQVPGLELRYQNRIAELAPCPASSPNCIADGIAVGTAAAEDILALRANDGAATPHRPYTLTAGPGVYQLTPPQLAAPQFEGWGEMQPFVLNSPTQFRASFDEAMQLDSERYAQDFNEVKSIGSAAVRAAAPDSEQSRVARFWPGGGADTNSVTRVIVAGRGLDLWQHARLFALLNLSVSDAVVTVFETKFFYNFWRPVTAIRQADTDGNPATAADPAWLSYIATPPYPDYTCGLPNVVGSSTETLRQFFGTSALQFTFTAAGITRTFRFLPDADADAVNARVFGGIHFRTGCTQGIRQGSRVAKFVQQHALRPL